MTATAKLSDPNAPMQAHPLPRSGPQVSWDPLALDVQGSVPIDDLATEPSFSNLPPASTVASVSASVTKAVTEILLGTRAVHQVQRWVVEDIWHTIHRRAALSRRTYANHRVNHTKTTILRVHPCVINDHRSEAAVVFTDGARIRCAALQLTWHRNRWRVSALKIG